MIVVDDPGWHGYTSTTTMGKLIDEVKFGWLTAGRMS
jgi:hypothetical protein